MSFSLLFTLPLPVKILAILFGGFSWLFFSVKEMPGMDEPKAVERAVDEAAPKDGPAEAPEEPVDPKSIKP